ncbi:MAG: aldehyde dehydrogenase family protein, partial [Betaproteobacteria bacterium]|nr:aldehyde dehydrogenase family protein [Betaproteobacteria bacterium]
IIPYDTEEDAIRIANDTVYGLAAGVWSATPEHAKQVADKKSEQGIAVFTGR